MLECSDDKSQEQGKWRYDGEEGHKNPWLTSLFFFLEFGMGLPSCKDRQAARIQTGLQKHSYFDWPFSQLPRALGFSCLLYYYNYIIWQFWIRDTYFIVNTSSDIDTSYV